MEKRVQRNRTPDSPRLFFHHPPQHHGNVYGFACLYTLICLSFMHHWYKTYLFHQFILSINLLVDLFHELFISSNCFIDLLISSGCFIDFLKSLIGVLHWTTYPSDICIQKQKRVQTLKMRWHQLCVDTKDAYDVKDALTKKKMRWRQKCADAEDAPSQKCIRRQRCAVVKDTPTSKVAQTSKMCWRQRCVDVGDALTSKTLQHQRCADIKMRLLPTDSSTLLDVTSSSIVNRSSIPPRQSSIVNRKS